MKTTLPLTSFYILLFSSSVFIPFISVAQTVDCGKSYINITKGTAGGTMEPGDTLQIKATFVVKSGTLDSYGFFDNIPQGTVYIPAAWRYLPTKEKFTNRIQADDQVINKRVIKIKK